MTNLHPVHKNKGFTLIETIIYIGLFGIMFTGIFVSIYPLLTGAERLTNNILAEGETAFILGKIRYALAASVTSPADIISTPGGNELVVTHGTEKLRIKEDPASAFCTPPLVCKMLVYSENGASLLPLNATRVQIDNFLVNYATAGSMHYLDVSFTANGKPVGPVRYYLNF